MTIKSDLFKAAHKMAKAIHAQGECYAVTFGECLKQARQAVKAVKEKIVGELMVLNVAQILMLTKGDGFTLKGWTNHGEGKAAERMSCFKLDRVHNYVQSLLQGVESYNLTLEVTFEDGIKTEFKIVK